MMTKSAKFATYLVGGGIGVVGIAILRCDFWLLVMGFLMIVAGALIPD